MLNFLLRRLLTTLLVMLGVSFVVFMIIHLVPGDPVRIMLGLQADQAKVEEIRHLMGFDRPLLVQYLDWLGNALRGNLGESFITGQSVSEAVWQRLPATMSLALAALLIGVIIALPAGIISALRPGSILDYVVMFFSQIGVSVPDFWLGILMILLFALTLGWLPPSGFTSPTEDFGEWLQHLVLPAMTVGLITASILTRFIRSAVLESSHLNHVKTARAKGLTQPRIINRHILRNAAIPIVTIIGLQMASLLGGVIIVEIIFAWPGLGRLALDAVTRRDYPMVQGAVLLVAMTFAVVNVLVDVLYAYLDPRVKY
ncbi:MAG: ABC transporter permease [Ardenticatenaceae bacterium]|nr:ABC transporter permease [Ardenticatenaceae bacterium]MCB9446200.1 ABC transporter permease [Ardenticatenaceae bacterium]